MSETNIADLPEIVLEKILSFLLFDEIAQNRMVCRKFNEICKSLLNRGFVMAERQQSYVLRSIKISLPRRESERRGHHLARHCEILSALETRISMLSMTFMKFIDSGLCCFIPGKIIDEILHIIRTVQRTTNPPRTHELLQELRDISSMAMEHFEEHIVPILRETDRKARKNMSASGSGFNNRVCRPQFLEFIQHEFQNIRIYRRSHKMQITKMQKVITRLNAKIKKQNCTIAFQSSKLREQKRTIQSNATGIADIKRHLEELDQKYADLSNEISKNREKIVESKSSQTQPVVEMHKTETEYEAPTFLQQAQRFIGSVTSPFPSLAKKDDTDCSCSTSATKPRPYLGFKYPFISTSTPVEKKKSSYIFDRPKSRPSLFEFRDTNNRHTDDIQLSATTNRKRKIMDLINTVADSKVSKPSDPKEISEFLQNYQSSPTFTSKVLTNSSENGNQGIKRSHDETVTTARKRFLSELE